MAEAATSERKAESRRTAVGDLPGASEIFSRAAGENFSVASLVLGRRVRDHLLAVYGFARLVDQIGDASPGNRLAQLDTLEHELDRIYSGAGASEHPVLARLAPAIGSLGLPRGPFERLIEANRRDQETVAYLTFEELVGYCDLSANPVGELVLHVFGVATPERIALSDKVCTALQLAEHWQDVAEDRAAGRIYLPAEDMRRFGVSGTDLDGPAAGPALRALMAFEVARGRKLLDEGASLVARLRGRSRLAVAGYVGGGRAAFEAIALAGYDVLSGTPKATRGRRARATVSTYARRG
jgi:squalene synthase HpnC